MNFFTGRRLGRSNLGFETRPATFAEFKRVYHTPISNRMRAMAMIAEHVGLDHKYLQRCSEVDELIKKFEDTQRMQQRDRSLAEVLDTSLDRAITRLLFPGPPEVIRLSKLAQVDASAVFFAKETQQRAAGKAMSEWLAVVKREVECLKNARLFYRHGLKLVDDDNLLIGLSDKDARDVMNRVQTLHDGFSSGVNTIDKEDRILDREARFIERFEQSGSNHLPINEIQGFFLRSTSLSILRHFLTRLWILENISSYETE